MKPILEVEEIQKVFGSHDTQVHALKKVSLTLNPGEFVVIMGASGSGKSTFLHILGGLETPTFGRIRVGGEENRFSEPHATEFRRNQIGFVFQFFNLLASLTAEENIALPMVLAGKGKKEIRERTGELLRLVGLFDRRTHYPSELSGGQQQRVALARALVNRPPILLADEPTGNLDTQTSAEMLRLLVEMRDRFQQAIVLVTHDPMVATYADRVLFFRDGEIVDEYQNMEQSVGHDKAAVIMEKMRLLTEVRVS